MITWSLWLLFIWWSAISISTISFFWNNKENENDAKIGKLVGMYLAVPAPVVLLDYLLK